MFVVYYIILLVFIIKLGENFRRSVLMYLPIRIAMHQGIFLWPRNPTVMLDTVICFFIVLYYFAIKQRKLSLDKFPFWLPLLIFSLSEFLSGFVASGNMSFLNFTQQMVVNVFFVYVVWRCIVEEKDIRVIMKGYSIMFSLALILACFEQLTHFNPVITFEKMLLPESAPKGLIWVSDSSRFGGLFRSQAFMPISITFGGFCLMFFIFYYAFCAKYREFNFFYKKKNTIFTIGLALGTVLSASKSPILSMLIGFIPYLRFRMLRNIKIMFLLIILIPLASTVAIKMYDDINQALTVEHSWEYEGGSSLAMRTAQLEISYNEFIKSPIIGNGIKSTLEVAEKNSELLGAESVWFKLLIEKGALGIIAYMLLVFYPFLNRRFENKRIYIALALSWIALNTMTTVPGLDITFYYTLIILVRKAEIQNKNKLT